MAWPTVFTSSYNSSTNTWSQEERQPTTTEKVGIVATAPLWGLVALGLTANERLKLWREKQQAAEAKRIADEARAEEARKLRAEELRLAEELRAKEDDDIFKRTNQLLTLDIGGCIATISKQYDRYTSVWHYRVTKDNLIIRTRNGDDATVCFQHSNEMMDDLQRYRWAGFELV